MALMKVETSVQVKIDLNISEDDNTNNNIKLYYVQCESVVSSYHLKDYNTKYSVYNGSFFCYFLHSVI
jgi:hypothetical protein